PGVASGYSPVRVCHFGPPGEKCSAGQGVGRGGPLPRAGLLGGARRLVVKPNSVLRGPRLPSTPARIARGGVGAQKIAQNDSPFRTFAQEQLRRIARFSLWKSGSSGPPILPSLRRARHPLV